MAKRVEGFTPLQQAAARLGITPGKLLRLHQVGRVRAKLVDGRFWFIADESLDELDAVSVVDRPPVTA